MSQRSPFNKRNQPVMGDESTPKTGMARGGASQAKPARAAAGTVRTVSVKKDKLTGETKGKNMTKEEKKALKEKEREEEDQVVAIANMIVKHNETYKRNRVIWWVFMVVGVIFVGISFGISYVAGTLEDSASYTASSPLGIATIVALFIAYAGIIGALIWDMAKCRNIRRQTEEEVSRMSQKRRAAVVEQCQAKDEEEKAAKKAKKAAKSSK